MRVALALPPNTPACRPKLALRRFAFRGPLASRLRAVQPANTNRENPCAYDEGASESCFWTRKDPIRFRGRQLNFYVDAGNDPVNRRDPRGQAEQANLACGACIVTATAIAAFCEWAEEDIGAAASEICRDISTPDDRCEETCAPLPPFPDCGPGYVGLDYDSFGNPCPGPPPPPAPPPGPPPTPACF